MTVAFSPGHITCFFCPVYTDDPLTTGSKGLGMKLGLGAETAVDERNDQQVRISINGSESVAEITRSVANILAPDRGFDIHVRTELPVSQGFGMSAAGSIAAGMCICEMCGIDHYEAYKAAHIAEVVGRGGLGDVAGISGTGPISMRMRAGLPPDGLVVSTGTKANIVLAVVGGKMMTKNILGDRDALGRLFEAGGRVCRSPFPYLPNDILRASRKFSSSAKLEAPEVSAALAKLPMGGMCMLGNSIFALCPEDVVRDALPDAEVYCCRTTDSMPIIHKV